MFQFYLSSIKRKEQADARKAVVEFQFYLSSIKSYFSGIENRLIKYVSILP